MQSTSTVDLIGTFDEKRYLIAPERSLVQKMDALKEANRVRFHRANLKRQLRAREVGPEVALADPDCDTMKVVDLLRALPAVGPVKANRVLVRSRISPSKTLGGLSDRQRRELLAMLPAPRVRA